MMALAPCLGQEKPSAGQERQRPERTTNHPVGVLLLAHGGKQNWNRHVSELAAQVDHTVPVEVALGMANKRSIQNAIDRLVARGAGQIVAVPLFVSSHSSVIRATRYLLGLEREAPPELALYAKMDHHHGEHSAHGAGADLADAITPIKSAAPIRWTPALDSDPVVAEVLLSRAVAISGDPGREVVILVAHGPNSDENNMKWLADMSVTAARIRDASNFRRIEYLTLRDDAPAPVRSAAAAELRSAVERAAAEGNSVLLVPLLVSYGGIEQGIRQRLEGLTYKMSSQGLLPDDRLVKWVLERAQAAASGRVHGWVRDEHGLAVAGAWVRIYPDGAGGLTAVRSSATDIQGKFRVEGLKVGAYRVEASAPGFEKQSLTVTTVELNGPVEFRLRPAGLYQGITVTATRQETHTEEAPLAAAVLSRQELDRSLAVNLAQGLADIAGVNWVNAGAFRSRPVIRGLDSNRILVLVDGERLNNARTATNNAGIETSLVEMSDIEQVEVVRGPASVLYGSDALGGVIHIRTRWARPAVPSFGVRSRGEWFSNSDARRARLEVFGGNRWLAARASGSAGAVGDYRSPLGRVFGSGVDESSTLGDLRVYPKAHQSIWFKFLHRGAYHFGLPSLEANPAFLATFPFSKLQKLSSGYQANFDSPALSRLQFRLYRQGQRRDFFNRIAAGPSTVLSDTVTDISTWGTEAQATSLASQKHVLTYGGTWFHDRNRDWRQQILIAGPVRQLIDNAPSVPDSTFSSAGVFLQDEFAATPRLRLSAGARLDRFRLRTLPTENFDPVVLASIGGQRTDTALGGNAGASYQLATGWLVSANVGRAFRAPNLFERFFFGRGSVAGFVVPNPGLRPETSLQLDIGTRVQHGGLRAAFHYFVNNLRDLISSAPGSFQGQTTIAGQPVFQNVNIAQGRIQGVESTAEVGFSAGRSRWSPFVSAAWQRGTDRAAGEPLPLIAPFVGQAGLRWMPQRLRAWAELRSRVVTGSDRVPPGVSPISGFTVHTWRSGYEVLRGEAGLGRLVPAYVASVNLHFSVDNLAGRLYRGLFETVPQPGRDFRFGLDLNIDSSAR